MKPVPKLQTQVGCSADNKLTPGKTKNYGTEETPAMGYEAATYYAKFEYDVADLTILPSMAMWQPTASRASSSP